LWLHESAQVDVSVDHLRLLCGGPSKRHTLSAMLPIIALHRHALARASRVSFMHAIILPGNGEISQLASWFSAELKFFGLHRLLTLFIGCDLVHRLTLPCQQAISKRLQTYLCCRCCEYALYILSSTVLRGVALCKMHVWLGRQEQGSRAKLSRLPATHIMALNALSLTAISILMCG